MTVADRAAGRKCGVDQLRPWVGEQHGHPERELAHCSDGAASVRVQRGGRCGWRSGGRVEDSVG